MWIILIFFPFSHKMHFKYFITWEKANEDKSGHSPQSPDRTSPVAKAASSQTPVPSPRCLFSLLLGLMGQLAALL